MLRGVFPYPLLLAVLAFTTSYAHDHPAAYWCVAAACVFTTGARVALMLARHRLHRFRPRVLHLIFALTVAAASLASGFLYASTLWWYGLENWTFTSTMVWIIGQVAGATVSFTPSFMLLQVYTWTALGPACLAGIWQGGKQGDVFAFATAVLAAFVLTQGRSLHQAYWRALAERSQIESAKAAAEAASVAKSQFLANMSHEIRTPMHGVLGLAEMALDAETLEESKNHVRTLYSSAQSLLQVLNDILDFSKVEAGKLVLESVPFSLRALINEVRGVVAPQAAAKGISLVYWIADGLPATLSGDPGRLRQVLVNLLGNAVKFTSTGSVALEVRPSDVDSGPGRITLHFLVRDTGIGIPREKLAVIFEAFGQADSSMTRRFGGTGLGLSISSQLVELMGGRMWVDSTPGLGSTFHFTCTLRLDEASRTQALPADPDQLEPPLRIMLAEDNPVNQKVASSLLSKRGHSVKVASTGIEVLRAWEAENFDVILMDNQMPEMDGVEAVRRLREREASTHRARTPVVALSASAMLGDRERFLAAGMDAYLAKPFRAQELSALLRQIGTSKRPATSAEPPPARLR